ncbi:MAG: fibronectin type III-like domain-contianing protein, partial [Bacteroidetes bacterium]|nr:fibronectin type III-like domain-contianing protein [Bacteroidota bacterium]
KDNESSLPRPEKELKAFEKVSLEPGASATVNISLGEDAFSYYDDGQGKWVLENGMFTILVGSSSRDIRLSGEVEL